MQTFDCLSYITDYFEYCLFLITSASVIICVEQNMDFCFSSEIFASADAAYVLAYSVIMLTTDLHSSQV